MSPRAEEYREHADECYRLSIRLKDPEHSAFALFLARAWLTLAKETEQKQSAPDATISTVVVAIDPQPKDPIE